MPEGWQSTPTGSARNAKVGVVRLAERQWGIVTRAQLVRCGVSESTLSDWVATARLQRIHPRVYAVGHRALSTEGRLLAAILIHPRDAD